MNINKNRRFKILFVILAFFLLHSTINNPISIVASSDATATIRPGSLTLETKNDSSKFILNDEKTITTGNAGTLVVTDATGSGAGWHVTIEGSPVVETRVDGSVANLPEGSFRLYKDGAKMTSNGGEFPHFFDSNFLVLDDDQQKTVLTAYRDEGMGQFHITFAHDSLRIYLANYNKDSTYSASITWSITQGP